MVSPLPPSPRLAHRVAAVYVAEHEAGEAPVFPLAGAVLGIQYRGRIVAEQGPLSQAGVTGIQSTTRHFVHPVATGSVLVRFTAQGTACLGVPASELVDSSVSLEDLLGRARSAELCERLSEALDDRTRVLVVEEFLTHLPFAKDPLVAAASALLMSDAPRSVAQVAVRLGVSERQLERRFRARVGVSPKHFFRLARFERAVNLVRALPPTAPDAARSEATPSLATIAQLAGYHDQSHFTRDVRQFAGVTPGKLFSAG